MKKYPSSAIRNVCLLSHGGVGKTSLLEAVCFTARATPRLGKVNNGTSIFDTRPDEKERKMTITTHLGFCEWQETKINILDTPGFLDFLGDAKGALRVVESAVVLVDAQDGIQVGTELVSRLIDEVKVPAVFFVNSMDKENADFAKVLGAMKTAYGSSVAPLTIPIGKGPTFTGVVDLISKKGYEYAKDGSGMGKEVAVPADLDATVDELRQSLMEAVAESDEALMNKFFESGALTDQELRQGLAKGVAAGLLQPLLTGCALHNMGVDHLLSAIVSLCPPAASRREIEVTDGKETKMIPCAESGPTLAFIFKMVSEEHLGDFDLVRVFSGSSRSGRTCRTSTAASRNGSATCTACAATNAPTRPRSTPATSARCSSSRTPTRTIRWPTRRPRSGSRRTVFPEPLVSVAIASKNKGDDDKLGVGLAKLHEEDVTFTYKFHGDIRQSILSAMGDIQIEVILDNLKRRFKVEVERHQPKISYRETDDPAREYVEYTHKKQTGGAGQYARVFIDLEPHAARRLRVRGQIVGGVIDQVAAALGGQRGPLQARRGHRRRIPDR